MVQVNFQVLAELDAAGRAALLRRSETDLSMFLEKVGPILEAVRTEGDAALVRFGRELDRAEGLTREGLKVTEAEFDEAFGLVEPEIVAAIRFAIGNIRTFHEEQAPEPMWLKELRPGAFAGDRFTPIRSVALYVPRGKGSFPSVTMMTSVPAVVAKVPQIAIFTPPAPDGRVDAATLVAARLAGVETVYKVGGAQAVAAAAYGTETVTPALKIVGPGSPWVVAAKRLLAGVIDPGLPAGPSESIILADETVHGGLAALDLLIEGRAWPRQLGLARDPLAAGGRGGAGGAAGPLVGDDAAAGGLLAGRALRAGGRHRADRLGRRKPRLRQRLRARASADPVRETLRASGADHRGGGGADGAAHAHHHRELLPRAECGAAHLAGRAPGGRSRSMTSCAGVRSAMSPPPPIPNWPRWRSGLRNTRASRPTPTPWARCATPI